MLLMHALGVGLETPIQFGEQAGIFFLGGAGIGIPLLGDTSCLPAVILFGLSNLSIAAALQDSQAILVFRLGVIQGGIVAVVTFGQLPLVAGNPLLLAKFAPRFRFDQRLTQ
jgi:hypothetical protein